MDSRVRALLGAAYARTAVGRRQWSPISDEAFQLTVGRNSLVIRRGWVPNDDEVGGPPPITYTARVFDELGRVVAEGDVSPDSGADYRLFADTFEVARRSALGSDWVLDEMLTALQGGE